MKKTLALWTSAAAIAIAGAHAAHAQQASPGADTIATAGPQAEQNDADRVVITARKTAEVLRDVPLAATVIDNESIEARGGVLDAEQLLADIPSVRYAGTSTGLTSEITIRNSGPARGGGSDGAVGLYANGAYIAGGANNVGSRNFADIDYFDIGRVEVLRGTQGALYGRNAVGGAVNIISQRPTSELSAIGDVRYGINNERLELQAIANVPLTDKISTRFGIKSVDQTKGFFHNTYLDRYHDDTDLFSYRAQINYRGERLELNLLGENQIANVPQLMLTAKLPPSPESGLPNGYYDAPRTSQWGYAGAGQQDITMFTLSADYEMDWATLSSTTMWRKRASHQGYDTDLFNQELKNQWLQDGTLCRVAIPGRCSAVTAALRDGDRTQDNWDMAETWFVDARLAGEKTGRLSWLLGAEYLQVENGSLLLTYQSNINAAGVTNPSGMRTDSTGLLNSIAYYGSFGYDVTDNFNLTVEGRQVEDRRKRYRFQYNRYTGAPSGSQLFRNASSHPENFSYNVTAGYKLANNWLLYAKIGTAFRAGGFNANSGDPREPNPIPDAFGDENTKTYEIGAKGDLSSNIFVTLAAYQSEVKNIIVQRDNGCFALNPVCPVASTLFFSNAGDAEPKGVEAELSSNWNLFGGRLRANASAAWMSGKITSGPLAGSLIPQSPEWTGALTMNYRRPLTDTITGFANLVYSYQAGGVQEIEQTPLLVDRGLMDFRFGVNLGDSWELAANITNALDEDYIVFDAPTTMRQNVPRNITLQARYTY